MNPSDTPLTDAVHALNPAGHYWNMWALAERLERERKALDTWGKEMQEQIVKLTSELADLRRANEWHPASEPPDTQREVWSNYGLVRYAGNVVKFWRCSVDGSNVDDYVKTWIELPKPEAAK